MRSCSTATSPRSWKAGLSAKTVGNTLTDMRLVLKQAVRQRLIRANPVDDVERPRCEPPDMQVLSEAEIARLWSAYGELEREASEEERSWWQLARAITFVRLGTAMRRGELLGLRWSDVRMLDAVVQVREAFVDGHFTTPKSRSSRRLIELGPRTLELFGQRWQETAFRDERPRLLPSDEGNAARREQARPRLSPPRPPPSRDHKAVPAVPRPASSAPIASPLPRVEPIASFDHRSHGP